MLSAGIVSGGWPAGGVVASAMGNAKTPSCRMTDMKRRNRPRMCILEYNCLVGKEIMYGIRILEELCPL